MAALGTVTKKWMCEGLTYATQALAEQHAAGKCLNGQTIDIEEIDCTVVSQVSLPAVTPTISRVPAPAAAATPSA